MRSSNCHIHVTCYPFDPSMMLSSLPQSIDSKYPIAQWSAEVDVLSNRVTCPLVTSPKIYQLLHTNCARFISSISRNSEAVEALFTCLFGASKRVIAALYNTDSQSNSRSRPRALAKSTNTGTVPNLRKHGNVDGYSPTSRKPKSNSPARCLVSRWRVSRCTSNPPLPLSPVWLPFPKA